MNSKTDNFLSLATGAQKVLNFLQALLAAAISSFGLVSRNAQAEVRSENKHPGEQEGADATQVWPPAVRK